MIEILKTEQIELSKIIDNTGQIEGIPKNPRFIKNERYSKLLKSIEDNPEFLGARELIVYKLKDKYIVLCGNMRYKAAKELKIELIPCKIIPKSYTIDQIKAIIIKDNISYGNDDFDALANEWDASELSDWGLDIPQIIDEIDYSILDEDDIDIELDDMANNVKKAIQIEFNQEHYYEALEIVKFWRDKKAYIGGMFLEYLKNEKSKL